MADLIRISSDIIDGRGDPASWGPVHSITQELSELGDGIAIVESFSHVVCLSDRSGLTLFDTSGKYTGADALASLRKHTTAPVHTIVFTHGHVDHVGGAPSVLADGQARGHAAPRVIGHENVAARFERYRMTNGYNLHANRRQFSGIPMPEHFLPPGTPAPTITVRDQLEIECGELRIELRHARGETDDHLWAFIPERRVICAGDFFIWNFPNAGNPQKAQRYPLDWARALRDMAGRGAELFIPAHGLPIAGRERIERVLIEVAQALESLVERTLALMNQGAPLDTILHEVKVPPEVLAKPYLLPLYDEPEFVVRNIYRLYGGWYDGNPAHLKPAQDGHLARELSALIGGTARLIERAREVAQAGDLRLACHLIELAVQAGPQDKAAHAVRYEIYGERRKVEISMIAKGIYGTAANESWDIAFPGEPQPFTRAKGYAI